MAGHLAIWHSAESNRELFTRLVRELAPEIEIRDAVRPELLAAAQPVLTRSIRREVAQDLLKMADDGAAAVLCTCSTLGPGAESAADLTDVTVLRVDRPMIDTALDLGPRIAIAAALPSTLQPTRDLLERAAAERGVAIEVQEILAAEAWPHQLAGDREGYWSVIAEVIRAQLRPADAVILAQASMAGALKHLGDLGVPVLSSPALGAAAAVAAWRRAVGRG